MSYLSELIEKFCGDGVEWGELGEVCEFNRGKSITSSRAKKGSIPVISGGRTPAFYTDEFNRIGETIVVAGSGAYAGYISYWEEPIFCADSFSVDIIDSENLITRYVYYCLVNLQNKIYSLKKGAGIAHVYGKDLSKLKIPIPPIEVQKEIVRILDKFTNLIYELTRELTKRKKQYEYYRDKLLTFDDDIPRVKLGEVCELKTGGTPRTNNYEYWNDGNILWMSSGEVNKCKIYDTEKKITKEGLKNSNTKILPINTVVVALAGQGKTRGKVAITKVELCTNQSLCGIIPNHSLISEFLYFYLSNQYLKLRSISSGDGSRGGLNLKIIREFEIPLPPLEVQEKIANILDKFDKLCNDISEGIPAEIEMRQKQYEYYRDKLLTFKEREKEKFA